MEIQLVNRKQIALIDDEDAEKVLKHRWYLTPKGYVMTVMYINCVRTTVYLHRFVMGCWTYTQDVDHKSGNRLDNRKSELRLVSRLVQQINRHKHHSSNRSGIRGVAWYSRAQKWRARIKFGGKSIHLGLFDTKDAAIDARRNAEKQYFGEECPIPPELASCIAAYAERLLEQKEQAHAIQEIRN